MSYHKHQSEMIQRKGAMFYSLLSIFSFFSFSQVSTKKNQFPFVFNRYCLVANN